MSEVVSIIIPTWNNAQYLIPCLESIVGNRQAEGLLKVYVVDNGDTRARSYLPSDILATGDVVLIESPENVGWEGGLKLGLKYVPKDTEYVMFLNDDTFVPNSSKFWLHKMLQWFRDPKVAAVGPTSNVVMGMQNCFIDIKSELLDTQLLIGFCMLLRKSALLKAGGIDDTLPGGDDFDLSIRLVDKGYKMLIDRSTFVYHHGFTTGTKLKGDSNIAGGWNSYEMLQKTNTALIKKHGFARFQKLMISIGQSRPYFSNLAEGSIEDAEGKAIQQLLKGNKSKTYELGCGGTLTVPHAIGVDMIDSNEFISTIKVKSVAKIKADVSKELPFVDADVIIARHILEHLVDPIETLMNWNKSMKSGGRIVIAVPNEDLFMTIPINIEHKHAFTPAFANKLLQVCGFTHIEIIDPKNSVSFIISGIKK